MLIDRARAFPRISWFLPCVFEGCGVGLLSTIFGGNGARLFTPGGNGACLFTPGGNGACLFTRRAGGIVACVLMRIAGGNGACLLILGFDI